MREAKGSDRWIRLRRRILEEKNGGKVWFRPQGRRGRRERSRVSPIVSNSRRSGCVVGLIATQSPESKEEMRQRANWIKEALIDR
jgi:hypothetical protein